MRFSKLAQFFSQLQATTSRLEITRILARLFQESKAGEIDKICYLSLGRLAPLYEAIEFNLAEKLMIRVLSQAYEQKEEVVRKKYKQLGDLGDVAAFYDHKQAATDLSVLKVYGRLYEIAAQQGQGSVERKILKTKQLLADLDSLSAKYVVRIPLGKLRLGFSDKTIIDALSWMIAGDKSLREKIEAAYNVRSDIGQIAQIIKKNGLEGLKGIKVSLGTPLMPALCQRLPDVQEMIKKMGQVAIEPKYDGTRLLVHFSRRQKEKPKDKPTLFDFTPRGFIRTFTRNLEDSTSMFPDLAQAVFKEVKAQEAIFDCEAVGFDPQTGKLLPFQETIKRKRKHDIKKTAQEIPLRFFCFDLLYKDGRDLLHLPFSQRRRLLEGTISAKAETLVLSPQVVTDDPQVLRQFHDEQIKKGLEGAVVKKWQAIYEPGRRGYTWVKFKQEKGKKGGGLADTIDCVVMGYYRGRGKRATFGVGGFLVGVSNGDGEEFVTISKIGTGLSDDKWRELKLRCDKVAVKKKPKGYRVDKNQFPDIWCRPKIVVEIEADNITVSPIHTAHYAFRFPRLVRFRDDKSADQASTIKEVKDLYHLQI